MYIISCHNADKLWSIITFRDSRSSLVTDGSFENKLKLYLIKIIYCKNKFKKVKNIFLTGKQFPQFYIPTQTEYRIFLNLLVYFNFM